MSRRNISLKSRVRYEGRAQIFDRRPTQGADLEKMPNPIWYTVGQVLRKNFRKIVRGRKGGNPTPNGK
jgi:hypothetical protein